MGAAFSTLPMQALSLQPSLNARLISAFEMAVVQAQAALLGAQAGRALSIVPNLLRSCLGRRLATRASAGAMCC